MRRPGLAAAAALTLLLTGCSAPAPEATPTASAPPSPAVTSPATPSPTPTATTLVHPACDELVPLTVVRENFSSTAVLYDTPGELEREQALGALGPIAQKTLASAENEQFCEWIVEGGSDGRVAVFSAQLPPSDREELVTALRSSAYTPLELNDATAFGLYEEGSISTYYTVQAFVGSAWVIALGSGSVDHGVPVAQAAVDSLRAANPQLSG
ncbi:hypothetical protein [Microbacterium sp. zg-YB36]|uniref:hypothetical protein n=1 Tax=Microbacterium sp. zg-YB36 TaxID=2969407 RepID=UPI00214B7574|nr:hypothetical protein [Microbacterium sp. zg-YB36]MDL5350238.1 hypothetical protein [Microbacterium sp. zg-YB36]